MNLFRRIFSRGRIYGELAESIQEHLAEKIEELIEGGMTRDQAVRAARHEFGNTSVLEERSREVWQFSMIESIWMDIRYAVRQLRKSPGFAITAILLLGMGIGATTAVFSLVDAVLLKPLGYPEADRIVIPWRLPPKGFALGYAEIPWGQEDLHALEKESKVFQFLGAFQSKSFNLTEASDPVLLEGLQVSAGFFPALGVSPVLGRIFTVDEDQPGHEREVVLSYSLWQERFHADPGIEGRTIDLNGAPYTVIGVMPRDFAFPRANEMPGSFQFPREAQLWVPAAFPAVTPRFTPQELALVARLQPGVTVSQAQAAMDLFSSRMEKQTPNAKGWYNSHTVPLTHQVGSDTRTPLLLVLGAVGGVLLIVCFNIANLLLVRSIVRKKELTLRVALGATRRRVMRQLLTESLLLASAGGLLGVGIGLAGVWMVKLFGPSTLPRLQDVGLDWRICVFTLSITALVGVLFGVIPALGAARADMVESLKERGQGGANPANLYLRNTLIVSEVALALVLVIVSGLLVQTFYRLINVDPGFKAAHVLTFEIALPQLKYPDNAHIAKLYQAMIPQLQALPGVESAAVTEAVPMGDAPESTGFRIPDHPVHDPKASPIANYTIVSPDFFATIGTPLLRGRGFLETDTADSVPVVIVNEAMAKKYWPGKDVLGKQIRVPAQHAPMIIVGVVANMKHLSMREDPGPEMYVPYTQDVWPSMAQMQIVLRTRSSPESVVGQTRAAVQSVDPALPIAKVTTLSTLTDTSMAQSRFSMLLLGFFAALALVLALVGIYGVISYSVLQRRQEIGIRIALGAQRRRIFGMVIGYGLRMAALGVVIGLGVSFAVARAMASFLYGVKPADPATFVVLSLFLTVAALLACYLPARRAASVDPMRALRTD
jgi:predicted permease